MSEAVRIGPPGGVVWLKALVIERRPPSNTTRPRDASTEKQATPALVPPLRTQAIMCQFFFSLADIV